LLLRGLYALDGKQLAEARGVTLYEHQFALPWLWMGELYETGPENFMRVQDWFHYPTCPGPQMCPAEFFEPVRRCQDKVRRRDYM
jgi:hypothetical protein